MKVFVTAKGTLYLEHGCITRTTSHRSTVCLFKDGPMMMVEQQLNCGFSTGISKTSVCSVLFDFEGSLLIKEQGIVDMQSSEKSAFRLHVTYGNEKTRRKRTYYLSPQVSSANISPVYIELDRLASADSGPRSFSTDYYSRLGVIFDDCRSHMELWL